MVATKTALDGNGSDSRGQSLWRKRTPDVLRLSRSSLSNRSIGRKKRIMAQKRKPDRVDVVIVGAGACGATAGKVLTERGLRVVALERGPWRKRESFGGDELANVNRYNLWPDPILNPRTFRASADEEATINLFCPVPQRVGGGPVHWQGWLPRFTESDFNPRSIVGDV